MPFFLSFFSLFLFLSHSLSPSFLHLSSLTHAPNLPTTPLFFSPCAVSSEPKCLPHFPFSCSLFFHPPSLTLSLSLLPSFSSHTLSHHLSTVFLTSIKWAKVLRGHWCVQSQLVTWHVTYDFSVRTSHSGRYTVVDRIGESIILYYALMMSFHCMTLFSTFWCLLINFLLFCLIWHPELVSFFRIDNFFAAKFEHDTLYWRTNFFLFYRTIL